MPVAWSKRHRKPRYIKKCIRRGLAFVSEESIVTPKNFLDIP